MRSQFLLIFITYSEVRLKNYYCTPQNFQGRIRIAHMLTDLQNPPVMYKNKYLNTLDLIIQSIIESTTVGMESGGGF